MYPISPAFRFTVNLTGPEHYRLADAVATAEWGDLIFYGPIAFWCVTSTGALDLLDMPTSDFESERFRKINEIRVAYRDAHESGSI